MRLSMGTELRQVQKQVLSPTMIQRMEILQLPVMALQQRIEQEMNENPLLEVTDETETAEAEVGERLTEPETANDQEEELVVEDNSDNASDFERLLELNREVPDHFDEPPRKSANQLDEEASRRHDAMANAIERPTSLNDFLLSQLGELRIDEACLRMCMRIISALDADDGGRLNSSLEDLLPADASTEDLALAQRALEIVQSLEPQGIAARDLRECLLLQLTETMPFYDEVKALISDHLDDLHHNRMPLIKKKTGFSLSRIQNAKDQLKRLNPKPAAAWMDNVVPTVTPDVVVERRQDGTYRVILEDTFIPQLRISNYYRERLSSGTATPEEVEYIRKKVGAAQWLIDSVKQRRQTLTRVAQAIVDHQTNYLENGPDFIAPLRMQQIADKVGVHVTTVSRAVDDKWLETPRGILPLRQFFVGGSQNDDGEDVAWDRIRIKLQELVDNENKQKPYSDDDLVKQLKQHGMNVARRTVTKYRQKMGIPSSRQRRDWVNN